MIGTFIIRELLQQTSGNDTNIHYLELLYQTEIVRRGRSGASVLCTEHVTMILAQDVLCGGLW